MFLRLVLAGAIALSLHGQRPVVFPGGAVNAASYLPPTVPGGALPQGGIVTLFGAELGPESGEQARMFPLPMELAGTSAIVVLADGTEISCPLLYVQSSQINLVLPSFVPIGEHLLLVRRGASASPPIRIKAVRSSPGVFSFAHFGTHQLAGTTLDQPKHPGERFTVWLTGLGPISSSDLLAPPIEEPAAEVVVWIGNQKVERVLYAGRSGCCSGLDQIDLLLNDDTPTGCVVPIQVGVGGAMFSNMATISVARRGEVSCGQSSAMGLAPQLSGPEGRVSVREIRDLDLETTSTQIRGRFSTRITRSLWALDFPFGRLDPALLPAATEQVACVTLGPPIGDRGDYGALDAGEFLSLSGSLPAVPRVGDEYALTIDGGIAAESGLVVSGPGGSGFVAFDATVAPTPSWEVEVTSQDRQVVPTFAIAGASDDELVWYGTGVGSSDPLFVCRTTNIAARLETPRRVLANVAGSRFSIHVAQRSVPAEMMFATDGPEQGLFVYDRESRRTLDIGPPRLAATPVTLPNGEVVQAELAVSGQEQQRGLMFRTELDADKGMLFWYTFPGTRRFWMYNTLIPLDIIWMDSERRIIFVSADTPPCGSSNPGQCPTYGPNQRSRYVLELAAGEGRRRGLEVGDVLGW